MNAWKAEDDIIVRSHEPGGPYYIDLHLDGALKMSLGPYSHCGVGDREAKQLRTYMRELVDKLVADRSSAGRNSGAPTQEASPSAAEQSRPAPSTGPSEPAAASDCKQDFASLSSS